MDTKNRLIEREAQNQVSDEDISVKGEEMVVGFGIGSSSSAQVNYRNIEDEWNELISLKDLIDVQISNNSIGDYDLVLSDKVEKELKKLQKKVRQSYNEELDMYKLSYKINKDESSELYIPLETEFTGDVSVQKIYNEKEEFVAKNVENNIEFPLYELKTKELYIQNIPEDGERVQVCSKKEMTTREIMEDITADDFNFKDPIIAYLGTLFIYSVTGIIYTITGNLLVAGSIFLLFNFVYLAPFVLPLYAIVETYHYIYSYVKSKKDGYYKEIPEFKSKL